MKSRKSAFLLISLLICGISSLLWILYPGLAGSGTYTSTLHGNSTGNGVNRQAVTSAAFPDATGAYPLGHCGHCHEGHASVGGIEPLPNSPADAENPYNLFKENYGANKNALCYACHNTFNFGLGSGYGRYGVYQGSTTYSNSVHNTPPGSNMIWPAGSTPSVPYADSGNCHNCHNPHGYSDGTLVPSMAIGREQVLCSTCHDATGPNSTPNKDIATLVTSRTYKHNVGGYAGIHKPGWTAGQEDLTYISANKHVECVDCHNPHAVKAGTQGRDTVRSNVMGNVLLGVGGVKMPTWGTNWTSPTQANFSPLVTTDATTNKYEWQVCFKCHSIANSNVTAWGTAPPTGAAAWTNLALEFNPNNRSYHPVIAPLPATGNRRLNATHLVAPWVPGDTMTCSDCHSTDDTASKGPHGSAVKWMLAGTNKAWPYNNSSLNGTQGTTNFIMGTGTTTAPTATGGVFCFNCHLWAGGGEAHTLKGAKHVVACVSCHIRVPHGGKVPRLLNTATAGRVARYAPDGNGNTTLIAFTAVTLPASGEIGENNITTYNSGPCGNQHSTGSESW